jgi:hypothetical protein
MKVKYSDWFFYLNVVIARFFIITNGEHNTAIGYTTSNKNTAIGNYYW